jgi:hypothetical protein
MPPLTWAAWLWWPANKTWYLRFEAAGPAENGARAAYDEVQERAACLRRMYGDWRVYVLASTGGTARPSFTPRPREVRHRAPPFELNGHTYRRVAIPEQETRR